MTKKTAIYEQMYMETGKIFVETGCLIPLCTLQTLVSQLQQLSHGGGHGGVKGLQVHHAEPPVPLLHPHSDASLLTMAMKLH